MKTSMTRQMNSAIGRPAIRRKRIRGLRILHAAGYLSFLVAMLVLYFAHYHYTATTDMSQGTVWPSDTPVVDGGKAAIQTATSAKPVKARDTGARLSGSGSGLTPTDQINWGRDDSAVVLQEITFTQEQAQEKTRAAFERSRVRALAISGVVDAAGRAPIAHQVASGARRRPEISAGPVVNDDAYDFTNRTATRLDHRAVGSSAAALRLQAERDAEEVAAARGNGINPAAQVLLEKTLQIIASDKRDPRQANAWRGAAGDVGQTFTTSGSNQAGAAAGISCQVRTAAAPLASDVMLGLAQNVSSPVLSHGQAGAATMAPSSPAPQAVDGTVLVLSEGDESAAGMSVSDNGQNKTTDFFYTDSVPGLSVASLGFADNVAMPQPTPEPSTVLMLAGGAAMVVLMKRRRS